MLIDVFKQEQDQKIIAVLFDRYIHLVFASCMKYLKNEAEAQDMAMEIFGSMADKFLKHEVANFKSWLFVLTKNACLMKLRKQKNKEVELKNDQIPQLFVENESILHLDNADEENRKLLHDSILKLKEEQRRCIEFMYFKEKSYKEIADETGYGLSKVKSYIQNGKRNLKQMLEKHNDSQGRK